MVICFLGLGSNLGNRKRNIKRACDLLLKRMKICARSQMYETEPWGKFERVPGREPRRFLNCVVKCETDLSPQELLKVTQDIEEKLGRQSKNGQNAAMLRKTHIYQSRPIDIDILFYSSRILKTPNLKIPHPLISQRRFVLVPLAEILPRFRHPQLRKTMRQLLKECEDTSIVVIARPQAEAIRRCPEQAERDLVDRRAQLRLGSR